MLMRAGFTNWKRLQQLGLAGLAVAGLMSLFWKPSPGAVADVADGVKGFLYGIAIALMLMSVIRKSRMR